MTARILGELDANDFLRRFWQQQPLLVRAALPDYVPPLSAQELAGLALDADVESRLVTGNGIDQPWSLRHGPFQERDFLQLPERDWTLLVQALDLWVPSVGQLLDRFDFLPRWRLDDIMASYAVPGGSVGPHFDQYDVFLVQIAGQRRWRIGDPCDGDTPLEPGTELKILSDFQCTHEWLLNPGDMLYLPPRVAHWGVAETECMTFSVGARSPGLADMLGDLAIELLAQGKDRHYTDPALTVAMAGDDIDPAFIRQAQAVLQQLLLDDQLIGDWFARYMTAPKYPDLEDQTAEQRIARIAGRSYCNGDRSD